MPHALHELRTACLPFVTRALRGPRRRRFVLGSLLLGLLVVLVGSWAGQSSSSMAHGIRVSLDLEDRRWEREQLEYTIFVDDHGELQRFTDGNTNGATWGPLRYRAEEAWMLLDAASDPNVLSPRGYRDLQERAQRLRDERLDLTPNDIEEQRPYQHFDWYSSRDIQRLRAVLDADLHPHLVVYHSPLGAADTVRLVGALAGVLLLLLSMVIAPLWVGVHVAQELHENTLQPLTGTALSAGQLVLGLIVGALTPVAIAAAPLLLVHLGAAAIAGRMLPALGMVVMALGMGAMLVGLSMLAALAVGRQRAPGIVGISLLALLGLAGAIGLAVGLNLSPGKIGAVTVVPAAGPGHLLAEAFFPVNHLGSRLASGLDLRLALATFGAFVLSVAAFRSIGRVVGGTHRDGALTRLEAAGAAGLLLLLATAAVPEQTHFGETVLASIAVALVPMQLVLMARIPGGDVPPALRRVPVVALLREHATWLAAAVVLALMVGGGPTQLTPGLVIGLVHLAWALGVTMLVTLRGAGLPTSVPAKLWLMLCLCVAMLEYGSAAMWCLGDPGVELVFPLAKASPVLGMLHIGLFLWIPVSLARAFVPADRAEVDVTRLPELGE